MGQSTDFNIDLRQMVIAIETAVSLVGMNDTNHGKRVGYIASQIGREIGFSDSDIQYVFELGLLHDCGVSTEQMHSSLVNHFDWDDAYIHCNIGYRLLKSFEPLAKFSKPILYHHTPWPELSKEDISAHDAMMANLIFISDRIDILAASHYETDILLAREGVVRSIKDYSEAYFSPELVSAFEKIERSEAFWIALENRHITRYTWDMGRLSSNYSLTLEQIKQLSLIMSYIVDQKSPFTAQHSVRVADLAKYIATIFGLSDSQCKKIEIAGLLHDLGKLHTPDNVLEKPGPLNNTERSIMDQHSYETYEILRHIEGLGEIALWAAYHHEGIEGAGYPFHPSERDLSIEARIVAVADVFQALVQDRPYRKGMDIEKVTNILIGFVESGKLDKDIVNLVVENSAKCFDIAKGDDPVHNQEYLNLFSDM
ncbi:HD domain-containing phosphohydrolase [Teredinibacter sp. KSP-S5-2]|uniref:HD domain-containing phosphohydrolase n=1 Tax=Teredinibacter sp. KSP-S5-2 TaxID=3034506 RepID=UPI0029352A0A|nr:HD domain-containing phosphohydrolase [Teredinibacter sp. KSP-S5-2]WNO09959.1 HD domain-containing protein [Teredinibacter sp. KSP-S5-2]